MKKLGISFKQILISVWIPNIKLNQILINMNVEEIWDKADWVTESRDILNNLNKFPQDSKVILVLRHSHRNEPKRLEEVNKLRLTPQGHAIAQKFGESLPKTRSIRLFHSIIWRCEETAENIHNGFKKIGGKSEFIGEFAPLYELGIKNRKFLEKLRNLHFRDVLYRWAVGFYRSEDWNPFTSYCQNTAQLIFNHAKESPENGIEIHVSHDWHVMSLRFGWFGLPPDSKWIKFLGGFAFTFEDDHLLLLDRGKIKSFQAPHWWKEIFD